MAEESSGGIGWFLAGVGLGALVGVLFAPKAGDEMREYMVDRASEGADFMKQSGQVARESFGELIDRGKEFVERQKQQAAAAMDSAKQAYREKTESPEVS
ncbi:MAG: YtxH domain-containing protein [Acidobacteriaceae bacterium]